MIPFISHFQNCMIMSTIRWHGIILIYLWRCRILLWKFCSQTGTRFIPESKIKYMSWICIFQAGSARCLEIRSWWMRRKNMQRRYFNLYIPIAIRFPVFLLFSFAWIILILYSSHRRFLYYRNVFSDHLVQDSIHYSYLKFTEHKKNSNNTRERQEK